MYYRNINSYLPDIVIFDFLNFESFKFESHLKSWRVKLHLTNPVILILETAIVYDNNIIPFIPSCSWTCVRKSKELDDLTAMLRLKLKGLHCQDVTGCHSRSLDLLVWVWKAFFLFFFFHYSISWEGQWTLYYS